MDKGLGVLPSIDGYFFSLFLNPEWGVGPLGPPLVMTFDFFLFELHAFWGCDLWLFEVMTLFTYISEPNSLGTTSLFPADFWNLSSFFIILFC